MTKRLLNLETITKITLILTTLILLPSTVLADDPESYGITVGGVAVTSENASNIFVGDNINNEKVSFTPATADNSNNILTLNGAEISTEATPVIVSNLQNLVIKVIGTGNRLECSGSNSVISSTNANGFLSITDDNSGDEASVILVTNGDESIISGFIGMACTLTAYTTNSDFQPIKEMANVSYDEDNKVLKANGSNILSVYYSNQPITYDLTVAGTAVNSSNASNIFAGGENNGKVSFDPETNILTLNGATLNENIISNLDELIIDLQGVNSITTNGIPCITSTVETYSPALTIKSTSEQKGALTLKNTQEGSSCGGVLTRLSVTIDSSIEMFTPTQGTGCLTMDSTHVATFGEDYHISIGGVRLTNINISEISQDGKISYNSLKRILTLNGATIEGGIEWKSSQDLMISLNGKSSISNTSDAVIKTTGVDIQPNLTFAKADDASSCKLTLTTSSSSSITSGFNNVNTDGLYYFTENGNNSQTATISSSILSGGSGTNEDPFIIETADDLKKFSAYYISNNNLFREAYIKFSDNISEEGLDCSELAGFNPIGEYNNSFQGTFDGNNKTIKGLKINGGELTGLFGYLEGTVQNLILSGCTISGGSYSSNYIGGFAGQLVSGSINNCSIKDSEIACLSTSQIPTTGGIVGNMTSGTISNCIVQNCSVKADTEDTWASGPNANAGGIAGNTYGGTISGCKIKGTTIISADYNTFGTVKAGAISSDRGEGTFKNNTYDFTISTKEHDSTKSGYTHRGFGVGTTSGNDVEYDLYENNGAVLYTKKVTLPASSEEVIVAIDDNYKSEITDNSADYYVAPEKDIVVSTSTLSPYVIVSFKVTNTSDDTTVTTSSEELGDNITKYTFSMPDADVTAAVSYAKDISLEKEYYSSASIASATYTGETLVPNKVTITDNEENNIDIVLDTDYTITSYKLNGNTVTSPINAGTYTVTIQGKGNYTGTREIEYTINKASADWTSDAWTAPVAKEDMKYTGEAMDLITAGSAPEGATIKYLTVANPESYDYSESANEEWTTTVPQGTAVGDYAIFYKVEGGDNYENWGPSEVGIKASIDMGEVSISAEDQTSTYTGEEIAFDKNNIEISVSTISKDAIGLKYYAPNSENPEEPTLLDNAPINAGTYTVEIYLEDDNYTAESINATLTITKANITPTVSIEGWTYGATANEPSVSGNTGNGEVTYTYKAVRYQRQLALTPSRQQ